ncbi:MAG: YqgE/AlgH family protein [Betaproteobacteria bacterium]|nr:YqgE/AlgH family protein [Betaproteobacteria bacterium]MDH5222245.1 YqgE/AlgH family protein [Betaproteobacteria bacterium]MDH5352242.1 YqgE/AlgH family protein [Betaproteobacteria bacterium]
MSAVLRAAALALLVAAAPAAAQQEQPANGVLLVARPGMQDERFARSVVLVTQLEDGQTLGVILNKPAPARHGGRPLWFGGPVLPHSVVALFAAGEPPQAPAFHVLKNVYLTMHPQTIDRLTAGEGGSYRLYSGFSAWMPRQLEAELESDAWYVLPAEEALLFRADMDGLWEELVAKATGPRTRIPSVALQSSS